jgi:hypothetical protein
VESAMLTGRAQCPPRTPPGWKIRAAARHCSRRHPPCLEDCEAEQRAHQWRHAAPPRQCRRTGGRHHGTKRQSAAQRPGAPRHVSRTGRVGWPAHLRRLCRTAVHRYALSVHSRDGALSVHPGSDSRVNLAQGTLDGRRSGARHRRQDPASRRAVA